MFDWAITFLIPASIEDMFGLSGMPAQPHIKMNLHIIPRIIITMIMIDTFRIATPGKLLARLPGAS